PSVTLVGAEMRVCCQRMKRPRMLLVPSSRGGVAARSSKAAKPPSTRRRGGQSCLTTPSAPTRGCLRRYFLEVASTPPLEEGNSSGFTISSLWQNGLTPVAVVVTPLRG